jgi:hypothetical protein
MLEDQVVYLMMMMYSAGKAHSAHVPRKGQECQLSSAKPYVITTINKPTKQFGPPRSNCHMYAAHQPESSHATSTTCC